MVGARTRLTAELLHRSDDALGECPVWDDRARLLWRVDGFAGTVLSLDWATGAEARFDVGRHVGSVALREDGEGLILAAQGGFRSLDITTGATELLAPVASARPDILMNDGACDPAGRFVAGTMSRDATAGAGMLLRYAPPSDVVPLLDGIGVSNGLGWDAAGTTLYYVDSLLRRVDRIAYDVEHGAVLSREPAFDVSGYDGMPDGLEVDAEGCLWVAFWRGGYVRRFAPDGRLLAEVVVPVRRSTSCCLAGDDLRCLVITTARRSLRSDSSPPPEPLAGAVFVVEVDTPGRPPVRWRASSG